LAEFITPLRQVYQMNRASPEMRNFAKRLIASETKGANSAQMTTADALNVCERLRPQMVMLMGDGGFRALRSRAVALAAKEVLWLRAVHVKSDGALGGLEDPRPPLSPDALLEGGVAVLAQLLGLLVTFIGEELTLRLVREDWPDAPLDDLDLTNEGKK
jgi:hypothetical protein